MDFGHVIDPGNTSFQLPKDPATNNLVLSSGNRKLGIHVGCAKWDIPEWKGVIYPPNLARKHFLTHYGKAFNAVELNATFYSVFRPETLMRWIDSTPEDFLFCPKFHSGISHRNWARPCPEETFNFLESVSHLGEKLGPCFLQLHERTGPAQTASILNFLGNLPPGQNVFVELRHPAWFLPSDDTTTFFDTLEELRCGVVITDTLGRRDAVHMRLTVPSAFVRFNGYGLHPTDYQRIDAWVERILSWEQQGLEQLYFFMHQKDESHSPVLAAYFIRKLNEGREESLPEPIFYSTSLL